MPNRNELAYRAAVGVGAAALALASACAGPGGGGAGSGARPPREGFVTADDGVRLFYETLGEGGDFVVIPFGFYLRPSLDRLAGKRTLVFYHPRNRGRSDPAPLASVSLDRQIQDLEQLRAALGIDRMANFVDASLVARVPDVCVYENEWPTNLWRYFGALLGSFGKYDWSADLASLEVPRLVIHGREDGVPVAGARAWARGYRNARLIELSPAGHFPFLEQPEAFFAAAERFLAGGWPDEAQVVE